MSAETAPEAAPETAPEAGAAATSPTGDPWLLTPGPLTTSPGVKQAMLHDYGSRDRRFIEINRRLRERLVAIAGEFIGLEADFTIGEPVELELSSAGNDLENADERASSETE